MKDILHALDFRSGCRLVREELTGVSFDTLQADVVEGSVGMFSRLDSLSAEFENRAQRFCRPAFHFSPPIRVKSALPQRMISFSSLRTSLRMSAGESWFTASVFTGL